MYRGRVGIGYIDGVGCIVGVGIFGSEVSFVSEVSVIRIFGTVRLTVYIRCFVGVVSRNYESYTWVQNISLHSVRSATAHQGHICHALNAGSI